MSSEISLRNVKKFDGTNFQTWKFLINTVFVAYDVKDVVEGTRGRPNEEGQERKTWYKDNAKAMFVITSSIEDEHLQPLLTCSTAQEMWTKLATIHEQKSESSKLILNQRFHEYKMDASDSVVKHFAKVQNMARQLEDVGEKVSDVAIMAKILASLPSKYNSLITAWDSVDAESQTLNNLQLRLLKEETRLTAEEETARALAATSVSKKTGSSKQSQNVKSNGKSRMGFKCHYCKKPGHYERECRKKKRDETSGSEKCIYMIASSGKERHIGKVIPTSADEKTLLCADVNDVWLTDSGASRHITNRREWFDTFTPTTGESVSLGDAGVCGAEGVGTIQVEALVGGKWREAKLENVLYIPRVRKNLFSVGECASRGYNITFEDRRVAVKRGKEVTAIGIQQANNLYRMLFRVKKPSTQDVNVAATLRTWHERLGHVNTRTLEEMASKKLIKGVTMTDVKKFFCEACQFGKAHRLKFTRSNCERSVMKPGEYIHSDVCGPFSVNSLSGSRYFVTFKDDASGFRFAYFLKHKSDVFDRFKEFDKMIETKFGRRMKKLRVDNGKEYVNASMKNYLANRGIQMLTTAPYTPEQNGKAERDNRTIVESARTMLHAKQLPLFLWAEAVSTAIYILNRTTSSSSSIATSYEVWMDKKPELSHIKIFGSDAYVYVDKQFRKKLDPKAKKMILVGYQAESTNYRLYDIKSKKIVVSRNVTIHENRESLVIEDESSTEDSELPAILTNEDQEDKDETRNAAASRDESHFSDAEDEPAPAKEKKVLRDRTTLKAPDRYEAHVVEYNTPCTFQEAITGPDSDQWKEAVKTELEAHQKNNTWKIEQRKSRQKLIDSKWVFKILRDTTGEIRRYKARLCARGFQQQPGLDYKEIFSPVVRYDSLRVMLALVATKDLELTQFDVQTAFLYGELEEEIWMKIPEGLDVRDEKDNLACKLVKSLYGLKQSPRCWNQKFRTFLENFNFRSSDADNCIFRGMVNTEEVYLALFVDDGLLASKSQRVLDDVIKTLSSCFSITVGNAKVFAGLQIERDRSNKTVFLHQQAYTRRIIEKFGMCDAKAVGVPFDPHVELRNAEEEELNQENIPYREAVGSLMFLATVSRPDLAYAVNEVSRYLNKHTHSHWQAVKRIIRYLIGTSGLGITYRSGGSETELVGYSDANYAKDVNTRRSTTGYAFFLTTGIVTWSSQLQKHVTLSTTESEYVAAAAAAKEAMWLRKLISNIEGTSLNTTTLYVDNQSAIKLARNPEFHKRSKHIDVRYHYLRERVSEGDIHIMYVPTEAQRADVFTKPLPKVRFKLLCSMLGLENLEALKRREC